MSPSYQHLLAAATSGGQSSRPLSAFALGVAIGVLLLALRTVSRLRK